MSRTLGRIALLFGMIAALPLDMLQAQPRTNPLPKNICCWEAQTAARVNHGFL